MDQLFKYVPDALHQDTCRYLTKFLKDSSSNSVGINDVQCPKSWAVGHHEVLDTVLEAFTSRMEKETGKKLFPTYAYARYYLKGEELKCHTDRESCEYSATITLGHSGDVWPLWISEKGSDIDGGIIGEDDEIFRVKSPQKFHIKIGDAVIYKGGDAPHWRDKLDGEWQTQIFLHYVDQDGPNAEFKFDKRKSLAHHKTEANVENKLDETLYWFIPDAISSGSCDQMIEKFELLPMGKGGIGFGNVGFDPSIRDVSNIQITNDIGIGATLTGAGININNKAWKFDITHSDQSEYLKYDADGHYESHIDTSVCPESDVSCRKITVLAFLNDNFEGGKFYLSIGEKKIYPEQNKGTIIAFPSFLQHGVEPVTKGIRRSIVTWLVGPWFR